MDERVEKAVRDTAALLERLGHELVEHTPDYPLLLPLASIARILPGMTADTAGLPHRCQLERRDGLAARLGSLLGKRAAAVPAPPNPEPRHASTRTSTQSTS